MEGELPHSSVHGAFFDDPMVTPDGIYFERKSYTKTFRLTYSALGGKVISI